MKPQLQNLIRIIHSRASELILWSFSENSTHYYSLKWITFENEESIKKCISLLGIETMLEYGLEWRTLMRALSSQQNIRNMVN